MDIYDIPGQEIRRKQVMERTLHRYGYLLEGERTWGEWIRDKGLREVMFFAYCVCEDGDKKKIERAEELLKGVKTGGWEEFNTFTPFMAHIMLLRYGTLLSPEIRQKLEKLIFDAAPYNCLDCWDFVGVNDNTPAMIMTLLILSGEHYHRRDWLEIGEKRLIQLEYMIEDRTFISEFNSPTYHSVTLYALAALACYGSDENIRRRALEVEKALWKMSFLMFHRDTWHTAGPYSRAYMVDSLGHTHQFRMIFYQVMGEKLKVNPINTIYREWDGFPGICYHNDKKEPWFLQFSDAWLSAIDYHCPAEYIEEALRRPYPRFVKGDAQISVSADTYLLPGYINEQGILKEDLSPLLKQEELMEYSAGVTEIFSYQNAYYAMGTCTKEFHNGVQTDSFHVLISQESPAGRQEDITTIYTRYLINNQAEPYNLIPDMGRKMAFQQENTAMVLYSPKTLCQEITSLKLAVLMDNRFGAIEEIRTIGGKLALGDELSTKEPVFVNFRSVYAAFYPLAQSTGKIRVEEINTGISLSLIYYEGNKIHFTKEQLKMIPAGFVCEIRSREEAGSFEEFMEHMINPVIQDTSYANHHTRYAFERIVSYEQGERKLECSYSPVSEGIRFIRTGGKLLRAREH